jgi:hypothetical protein
VPSGNNSHDGNAAMFLGRAGLGDPQRVKAAAPHHVFGKVGRGWETRRKEPDGASRPPRPTSRNWPSGRAFTLVELLVATVALVILVTVTASIVMDSESIWTGVTGKMENDRGGRTALSMITHDLECAVADSNLTWSVDLDRYTDPSYGHTNNVVYFVSLQDDPTNATRAARAIYYWVQTNGLTGGNRYELVRGCYAITNAADTNTVDNCYWNTNWYEDPIKGKGRPPDHGVVAENVSAFRVIPAPVGGSHTGLPEYVDVLLEVIPERTARQVADMMARTGSSDTTLVEQNAKRYTTRVFFQNRHGYQTR